MSTLWWPRCKHCVLTWTVLRWSAIRSASSTLFLQSITDCAGAWDTERPLGAFDTTYRQNTPLSRPPFSLQFFPRVLGYLSSTYDKTRSILRPPFAPRLKLFIRCSACFHYLTLGLAGMLRHSQHGQLVRAPYLQGAHTGQHVDTRGTDQ